MNNQIEVEIRGPLTRLGYNNLLEFLKKEGKFRTQKNRILIDFTDSLPSQSIREREIDFRIRETNAEPEIIMKLGTWGGDESRKEISVKTEMGSFPRLIEIFSLLGVNTGVLCFRNSEVFEYKDIEFAIVQVPGHSFYYEAEIMVSKNGEKQAALEKIKSVCRDLKLEIFDSESFFQYIEKLNTEINKTIDFTTISEEKLSNLLKKGGATKQLPL